MLSYKNASLVGSGLFALLFCLTLGLVMPLHYGMAQSWNSTYGDQIHLQFMQEDAAYRLRVEQIEQRLYQYMNDPSRDIDSTGVFTIPVVVHIMHRVADSIPAPSTSNPTNEQIEAGIKWLNDAFRNRGVFQGGPDFTNAKNHLPELVDPNFLDTKIEFCLAQTDPDGNQTNGIHRVASSLSDLVFDAECSSIPGSDQDHCLRAPHYWDTHEYMNIWLVNSICADDSLGGNNCDIRGYSRNAAAHGEMLDGPVIEAKYWGTSADSQTISILQVGRYLNLLSTSFSNPGDPLCQNDDCLATGDRVCDTPPVGDDGDVFCGNLVNSCYTDGNDPSPLNPFAQVDVDDIYENFMDSRNMDCKNSFTPGQRLRMRRALLQVRNSLLQSNVCSYQFTNASLEEIVSPASVLCLDPLKPLVRVINTGTFDITSLKFQQQLDQLNPLSHRWTGNLPVGDTAIIELKQLSPGAIGMHKLRVEIVEVNEEPGDFEVIDNVQNKEFYFFQSNHVISDFPYCVDGEERGEFPKDWKNANPDGLLSFEMYATSHCSTNGEYAFLYNSSKGGASLSGTRDYLISPRFDLTEYNQASLNFDVAYKAAEQGQDLNLRVWVKKASNGEMIATPYQKGRCDLQTAQGPCTPIPTAWTPMSCQDWRTEEINLDAYVGEEIFIIFEVELESSASQNLYLDNLCLDANIECPVPTHIPTKAGVYVANKLCVDKDGWSHYWKSAQAEPVTEDDLLLLSIKYEEDNDLLLPPGEVKILVRDGYGNGGYDLSALAPYVSNEMGWFVMGRCFWTTPLIQANDSVLVRFYYSDTDLQDLQTALPNGMQESDMVFYTIEAGLNPDPILGHEGIENDQYREYRSGEEANLRQWVWKDHGGFQSATYAVQTMGSGGGGTGGDGLGSGALYPPKIQNFQGIQYTQRLSLSWTTLMEWGTTEFEVYRSLDGENFELLGAPLEAQGNRLLPTEYQYHDESAEEGMNHYFIRLRHANGLTVASDTIKVLFDPARFVNVFPNPTSDFLNIALEVDEPRRVHLGIYDGKWSKLVEDKWLQVRTESRQINIQHLAPGIYFFVVRYDAKDYRGKLVKLGL